jgi:hypothetical protein
MTGRQEIITGNLTGKLRWLIKEYVKDGIVHEKKILQQEYVDNQYAGIRKFWKDVQEIR